MGTATLLLLAIMALDFTLKSERVAVVRKISDKNEFYGHIEPSNKFADVDKTDPAGPPPPLLILFRALRLWP